MKRLRLMLEMDVTPPGGGAMLTLDGWRHRASAAAPSTVREVTNMTRDDVIEGFRHLAAHRQSVGVTGHGCRQHEKCVAALRNRVGVTSHTAPTPYVVMPRGHCAVSRLQSFGCQETRAAWRLILSGHVVAWSCGGASLKRSARRLVGRVVPVSSCAIVSRCRV